MKVSKNFILREIVGEYILVPVGKAASKFNGLITMNEMGHFIFQTLQEEQSVEDLVNKITGEYQVDTGTAQRDLEEYLQQLRELGALIET